MRHLRELKQAGLTHVHLLPSYDFGSVPERAEDQLVPQVRPSVPRSPKQSCVYCTPKLL